MAAPQNSQCGAFSIEINIKVVPEITASVSADQDICSGSAPAAMTVTTNADEVQWQVSTTSCTTGFTDIAGETSMTYAPTTLNTTTYYRAVLTNSEGTCNNEVCEDVSDCITVVVNPLPTLTIDPQGPFCIDSGIGPVLTATPPGGVFSGPGIAFSPSAAGVGTHTITYTYTDDNGCTNMATIDIVVQEPSCYGVTVTRN